MADFSSMASSPTSACCQETFRHPQSLSSPTPAVFLGHRRLKPCSTRLSDDDDLASPPHQSSGHHRLDQMDTMTQQFSVSAQEQDDNEYIIEQVPIDSFSPTNQASLSFPSTRSFGSAAPSTPSPSLRASLLHINHENRPLELAASSILAMPPSAPDYMDISPASNARITDSPAGCNRQPSHLANDPFSGPFDKTDIPRRINMELLSEQAGRNSTASPDSHHSFVRANRSSFDNLCENMDIDSPGYHKRSISCDYGGADPRRHMSPHHSSPVECGQRPARPASGGSIGKRSRIDEDEANHHSGLSPGFSRPSGRSRSSYPSMLRLNKPLQSGEPLDAQSNANSLFSPELLLSSSPTDEASPCVNFFTRKTLCQAPLASPISAFRFPTSKSTSQRENHKNTLQPSRCNVGDSANDSGVKRAPFKVAQNSSNLFNRHRTSLSANIDVEKSEDGIARPLLKSPVIFIQNSKHLESSLSGQAMKPEKMEDPEEHDEMDMSTTLSCSPSTRAYTTSGYSIFSDSSSNYGFKSNKTISSCSIVSKTSRSAAPLALNYLQPPLLNSTNALQSPTGSFIFTLGSSIRSPVGMAFSEKERAGKILPCHKVSSDGLMRILPETMDKLLDGVYDDSISRKMIIDCRFRYEYEGGHIREAINLQDKEVLETMLLHGGLFKGGKEDVPIPSESGKPDANGETKKVVLIFHCEYSAMRAPTIAKYLREQDRHMNMTHYPELHYPEIYILEGGYAKYHAHSPQYCSGNYVQMDDPTYRSDRQTDLTLFRTRESTIFSRAKSFTYGESNPPKHSKKNEKAALGPSRFGLAKKFDLLCGAGKENTPTRNKIIEEEDELENDYLQASSPLCATIAGSINAKKSSLKAQGRSISMLANVEQNQPKGFFTKTNTRI